MGRWTESGMVGGGYRGMSGGHGIAIVDSDDL